jgi:DNA modification methylase
MIQVLHGDCRDTLRTIPDGTVQMCVTSPPYWGLRSYLTKGHADKHLEIGQEPTPEAYVETMVGVFREVKRCLHDSGTLWLNVGDSYATNVHTGEWGMSAVDKHHKRQEPHKRIPEGCKPKDLCGIPWRLVLALQADGWYWRSCIVWHKKSCMPESVTDRPTNSWEPIFLLAKSQRYFYDAEAVKEQVAECSIERAKYSFDASKDRMNTARGGEETFTASQLVPESGLRNQRNVWTLGPEPYSEAHFATFPTEIPRRAILAGTSARGCCPKCHAPWTRVVEKSGGMIGKGDWNQHDAGDEKVNRKGKESRDLSDYQVRTVGWEPGCECGSCETCGESIIGDRHLCIEEGGDRDPHPPIPCTVLDPFGGSGTTGAVALELGRHAILCELNDAYLPLIQTRTNVTKGLQLA